LNKKREELQAAALLFICPVHLLIQQNQPVTEKMWRKFVEKGIEYKNQMIIMLFCRAVGNSDAGGGDRTQR
jgi:hypothetical protein